MTSTTHRFVSASKHFLFPSTLLTLLYPAIQARAHWAGDILSPVRPTLAPCIIHTSLDNMLKKCPLPTLVIGNSLTMNNDGHQGAKCPMQDTIKDFLQQEGATSVWLLKAVLIHQPHKRLTLKSQSAVSGMHLGICFIQRQIYNINGF